VKKVFVGYLVLNLLLEGLAAVFLIGGPQGVLSDAQADGMMWAMNYGFAAIAIASTIFWIWPGRDNRQAVGAVLGILFVFHAMIFVSVAIQGDQIPYVLVHGVMAVFAIFLYAKRSGYTT